MENWKEEHRGPRWVYRTREEFVIIGRGRNSSGEQIELPDSEYAAYDTAVLFLSRRDTEQYAPLFMLQIVRWGIKSSLWKYKKEIKYRNIFCAC